MDDFTNVYPPSSWDKIEEQSVPFDSFSSSKKPIVIFVFSKGEMKTLGEMLKKYQVKFISEKSSFLNISLSFI